MKQWKTLDFQPPNPSESTGYQINFSININLNKSTSFIKPQL